MEERINWLFYLKAIFSGEVSFFYLIKSPTEYFSVLYTSRLPVIIHLISDPEKVLWSSHYDSWQDVHVWVHMRWGKHLFTDIIRPNKLSAYLQWGDNYINLNLLNKLPEKLKKLINLLVLRLCLPTMHQKFWREVVWVHNGDRTSMNFVAFLAAKCYNTQVKW
mgnify:CR=1 FL=1